MSLEDKYRRKPSLADAPPVQPAAPAAAIDVLKAAADTGKRDYEAFRASPHPELELWIRTGTKNKNGDVILPYSHRCQMNYDGGVGVIISMQFNGTRVVSVTLHGRNLHEAFLALWKHKCEWVEEFDPALHNAPEPDKPCITGMEITYREIPKEKNGGAEPPPGEAEPDRPTKH